MKPNLQSLPGLPAKDSSTPRAAAAPRTLIDMGLAHFLGFETIAEKAKALPAKAAAAVSRTLGKGGAVTSISLPQDSRAAAPPAPAPVASAASTSVVKEAIAAERTRAAEILVTGIRAGRVNQACALAFDSNLTAAAAVNALSAAALDDASRSAGRRSIRMGLDADQPSGSASRREPTAKEVAARIIAAGERAAGRDAASTASNPLANRIVMAGERARGDV